MDKHKPKAIHWFRQDLRSIDNESLFTASQDPCLAIYIFDPEINIGQASKVWLHHSLSKLNQKLDNNLNIYYGDSKSIILQLAQKYNIQKVYWNRCYEPERIKKDTAIKEHLNNLGIYTKSFNGSLLWEPFNIFKSDKTPYKIFSAFYKAAQKITPNKNFTKSLNNKNFVKDDGLELNKLNLLPKINWDKNMLKDWQIGQDAALDKFSYFLKHNLKSYKQGRDFPSLKSVSYLSPHLHFGEISPHYIWHILKEHEDLYGEDENLEHFLRELGWREFSYNLLYYFPSLSTDNLQKKFDNFPWQKNKKLLTAWQKGLTGYPIIDAGMRELWQTGYMHNRVRMIVGSFLVKNLLLHWHHGANWFFDCLLDADLANNSASWQWVAGSGTDAAPYFRIFNPITQSIKFDPDGDYITKYVPELKLLPKKYLFTPWLAPKEILVKASMNLGVTYPKPIVDLENSRNLALNAYLNIKSS